MSLLALPPIDLWAMGAATAAALALALRAEILNPDLGSFFDGPQLVRLSLFGSSIALGGRAVSIVGGNHAQAGEALVYSALAVSSWVLFLNLQRQRPERGEGDHG